ncbi:hypothetical protein DSECCO2_621720 [anaerobic digester metagenome]
MLRWLGCRTRDPSRSPVPVEVSPGNYFISIKEVQGKAPFDQLKVHRDEGGHPRQHEPVEHRGGEEPRGEDSQQCSRKIELPLRHTPTGIPGITRYAMATAQIPTGTLR